MSHLSAGVAAVECCSGVGHVPSRAKCFLVDMLVHAKAALSSSLESKQLQLVVKCRDKSCRLRLNADAAASVTAVLMLILSADIAAVPTPLMLTSPATNVVAASTRAAVQVLLHCAVNIERS